MTMDTDTIARLVAVLEHLAQGLKHHSEALGDSAQLARIADALEEIAALETHRLHDAAIAAERDHKTPSLTEAIFKAHPCRRCTHSKR